MERADRPREDAREAAVEIEPLIAQQAPGGSGLVDPGWRQVDIPPAGEAVLQVPLRLAVPQENEGRHQAVTFSRLAESRSAVAAASSGSTARSASRQA